MLSVGGGLVALKNFSTRSSDLQGTSLPASSAGLQFCCTTIGNCVTGAFACAPTDTRRFATYSACIAAGCAAVSSSSSLTSVTSVASVASASFASVTSFACNPKKLNIDTYGYQGWFAKPGTLTVTAFKNNLDSIALSNAQAQCATAPDPLACDSPCVTQGSVSKTYKQTTKGDVLASGQIPGVPYNIGARPNANSYARFTKGKCNVVRNCQKP